MSIIDKFEALAPFRVRSFQFQWPADLLTSWAFEMEMLVLGWYVLVTTDSVILLTAFGAPLVWLPPALFLLVGGAAVKGGHQAGLEPGH